MVTCLWVGVAALATFAVHDQAVAHGVWGHVHVTGWAIENLPEGELRDFFDDPEVANAAWFGSAFTDSGYAVLGGSMADAARAYGEHTHWEPFIQNFVDHIVEHDPPPWETVESRRRVAFLMGCASHGLQDEIFDSLFLEQVAEHDGGSQDEADPGVDGFLVLEGRMRFLPTEYIPMETLVELYAELDQPVTEEVVQYGVDLLVAAYLNDSMGLTIAENNGRLYRNQIPWTAEHYLDPEIPGSLRANILPTAAYMQAIWDRLHEGLADAELVSFRFPEPPRRLLSHETDTPDAWVTLGFSMGVDVGSVVTHWQDDDETDVPFTQIGTRWGANLTRLVRLVPNEALIPGGWYTVTLDSGAIRIDGDELGSPITFRFQVDCDEDNASECDDLGDIFVPSIDPVEEPSEGFVETDHVEAFADGPDISGDLPVSTAEQTSPPIDDEGCSCSVGRQQPFGSALLLGLFVLLVLRWRTTTSLVKHTLQREQTTTQW